MSRLYYRSIRDINPSELFNHYISNNKHNSLGSGMYFSLNYDFAKIFARNINLKNIAYLGEYNITLPENILELIFNSGKIDRSQDFDSFSAILIKERELCLKVQAPIELLSFSIISRNYEALAVYNEFKMGTLISEDELRDIPPSLIPRVNLFIEQLIATY